MFNFEKTCKQRGIPLARIGMKIQVNGNFGKIVGVNSSSNLDVEFSRNRGISNCHPTWETIYYNDKDQVIYNFREEKQHVQ